MLFFVHRQDPPCSSSSNTFWNIRLVPVCCLSACVVPQMPHVQLWISSRYVCSWRISLGNRYDFIGYLVLRYKHSEIPFAATITNHNDSFKNKHVVYNIEWHYLERMLEVSYVLWYSKLRITLFIFKVTLAHILSVQSVFFKHSIHWNHLLLY